MLTFTATIKRPKDVGQSSWGFVVLPKDISAKLPRRGRITVIGCVNNHPIEVMLEPDGCKSHWLKLEQSMLVATKATYGDAATFAFKPAEPEPEPSIPADLLAALQRAPESFSTWQATTTLARVDWIHWITAAKQSKTREKRIADACDMLKAGSKRVCCFDSSGFYSKAFSAPQEAESKT